MSTAPTPTCPGCGQEPAITLGPTQAFCGDDACPILAWNPTCTRDELEANRADVWIGLTSGDCVRGIGRRVEYRPAHDRQRYGEPGVIQEVRGDLVMVLYDGDRNAKATYPRDLCFRRDET